MITATILTVLSNPDVINGLIMLGSFVFGVITTYFKNKDKIKDGKEYSNFNLILEIAKEEALKIVDLNLSNEEKKQIVIDKIKERLPNAVKPFINDDLIEQALTLAYQHYIKPNIKKEVN